MEDWDGDGFRTWAADRLGRFAADLPLAARSAFAAGLHYQAADFGDPGSASRVLAVLGQDDAPVLAYLALPTAAFPTRLGRPRRGRAAAR